jgi:mono/diheme cytochrome c family protein
MQRLKLRAAQILLKVVAEGSRMTRMRLRTTAKIASRVLVAISLAVPINAAAQDGSQLFTEKCASCHTIGKGPLVGPDLGGAKLQAESQIEGNVTRMQSQAGPMTAAEITTLVKYLKGGGSDAAALNPTTSTTSAETKPSSDTTATGTATSSDASSTAAGTTKHVETEPPVKTEQPGSVVAGEELFSGKRSLKNQGMACVSCHSVTGETKGGLGPDPGAVATKFNMVALVVAAEKTPYRVMKNAYKDSPVTHDEAVDLAAYMSTLKGVGSNKPVSGAVEMMGFIGAAILIAAVAVGYRTRKKPARDKLTRR